MRLRKLVASIVSANMLLGLLSHPALAESAYEFLSKRPWLPEVCQSTPGTRARNAILCDRYDSARREIRRITEFLKALESCLRPQASTSGQLIHCYEARELAPNDLEFPEKADRLCNMYLTIGTLELKQKNQSEAVEAAGQAREFCSDQAAAQALADAARPKTVLEKLREKETFRDAETIARAFSSKIDAGLSVLETKPEDIKAGAEAIAKDPPAETTLLGMRYAYDAVETFAEAASTIGNVLLWDNRKEYDEDMLDKLRGEYKKIKDEGLGKSWETWKSNNEKIIRGVSEACKNGDC